MVIIYVQTNIIVNYTLHEIKMQHVEPVEEH